MKFWKVFVILICVILLLFGLIAAGIGVGIYLLGDFERPAQSGAVIKIGGSILIKEDYLYNMYGEYEPCEKQADIVANIDMPYGAVSFGCYLGDTAKYDPASRRLLIEFGVTEIRGVDPDKVQLFLVSDCSASGDTIISPTVRMGQSFTSFPCEALNCDGKATFFIVAYLNETGASTTQTNGIFGGGKQESAAAFVVVAEQTVELSAMNGVVVPPQYENTDSPDEDPAPAPESDLSEFIDGDWDAAVRADNRIYTTHYTFNADGTYTAGGCEYMHVSENPELFGYEADGWETVPMGYPYEYGTYTVHDGYIEIVCEGDSIESYLEPFVGKLEIIEIKGDSIVIITHVNGYVSEPKTFIKDFYYEDVEEICEVFGIDTAP